MKKFIGLACAAGGFMVAQGAFAADIYWDFGGTPTTLWSTLLNWDTAADGSGGDPAEAPGESDTAYFNITGLNSAQIATLDGALSIGGLVFNNTGTTAINTDTVANRTMTIGAGGITINTGAGAVTFGTTVANNRILFVLGAAQTWKNNSANALVLNANNTINTAGFALTFDGTGDFTGPSIISGAGSLTKQGAGVLTLSANNSYSGGTTLSAGTLNFNHASAVGTGHFTISGGTLDNTTAAAIVNNKNNTQSWNGNFIFTGTQSLDLGTGAVTLGANRTVTVNANTLTVGGVIDDGPNAYNLIKAGAGTLILSGANTYGGTTTIGVTTTGGGKLVVANGAALSTGGVTLTGTGTTLELAEGVVLANNLAIDNSGNRKNINLADGATSGELSGTITISETGTANFRVNVYSGGTLTISGAIGGGGAAGLDKQSAGTLILSGNNTFTGPLTVTAGTVVLNRNGGTIDNTANVRVGNGTLNVAFNDTVAAVAITNGTITGAGTLSGSTFTKSGTGTAYLYSVTTFTGTRKVEGGTLVLANTAAMPGGAGTLSVEAAGALGLGVGGAGFYNSTDVGTLWAGTLTGVTMDSSAGVGIDTAEGDFSYGSNLTGSRSLIKLGANALTLSGDNSYSGGTTLSGGTLNINSATAIGAGALNILGSTVIDNTSGGAITLTTDNNVTISGAFTFGGTDNLNLGSGTVSITAGRTITLNGDKTLTMGALVIDAAATANLTVNQGTGSGAKLVFDGYTLNANIDTQARTRTITVTADLEITGAVINGNLHDNGLTKAGVGTLRLSGNNTYTGATTLNNGTLVLNRSGGTLHDSGSVVIGGGTLDVAYDDTVGAVSMTAGTITGAGTLSGTTFTKSGTGIATLSGATSFSGAATHTAGTLVIANTAAMPSASGNLSVSAGATLGLGVGGTGDYTSTDIDALWAGSLSGVTMNSDSLVGIDTTAGNFTHSSNLTGTRSLVKLGSNALMLDGTSTYSGGTTVINGTLNINSATAIGSGTLTLAGGAIDNTTGSAITLANNNSQSWTATVTFTGTQDLNMGTGAVAIGGNRQLWVNGSTLTIGGVISGTGYFWKDGEGTLLLSGENTYSGSTYIRGGTLKLAANEVLPNNALLLDPSALNSTLDLNGKTETIAALTLSRSGGQTVVGVTSSIIDSLGGGVLKLGGNVTYNTGLVDFNVGTATVSASLDLNNATRNFTINDSNQAANDVVISGAIVNSGGTAAGLTKLGAGVLLLSGANTYDGATTLSNGSIKLGAANAIPFGAGKGAFTMNPSADTTAVLDLNGFNQTLNGFSSSGGGTSLIDNTGFGTVTLTIGDNNGTGTFAGTIQDTGGVLSLTRTANESSTTTITLSGANAYDGQTNIERGYLIITHAQALGTTVGGTVVASGAQLQLRGDITVVGEALTINGGAQSNSGALNNKSGNNTWQNDIILGTASTIRSDDGLLTIDGGIARATGNTTLTFRGAGAIEVKGVIGNLGTGTVTKNDAGTVTLSGNNTFGRQVIINNGVLVATTLANQNANSSLGTGSTTPVIRMGSTTTAGTLRYVGATAGFTDRPVQIGNGTTETDTGGATIENDGTGAVTFTAAAFNTPLAGSIAGRTLTLGGANEGDNSITGVIADNTASAPVSLAKAGGGTWVLSGANTFGGAVNVQTGMLAVAHNNALGAIAGGTSVAAGGTLGLQGGVTVTGEELTLTGSGFAIPFGEGFTSSGALRNISGNNTWAGSVIADGAGDKAIVAQAGFLLISGDVSNNGASGNLLLRGDGDGEISGQISGARSIFKSAAGAENPGTWTLSGNNTYLGNTVVAGGVLQVSSESNLGATPGSFVYNQLRIRGGTLRTTADMSISENRGVYLNLGGGGIDTAADTTLSVNSVISGDATGEVVKLGAGTMSLTSPNTYSGGTKVESGTLVVGGTYGAGNSGLGTGTVAVNGGALVINARHEGGMISVAGGAAIGGGGTVTGDLTLQSGALWAFDPALMLTVGGTVSLDNSFGIASLTGVNWGDLDLNSPYTLISSTSDLSNIQNLGYANRVINVGGSGRDAYLQEGSLQLVIIPEPASLGALGILALAALLRRRVRR